MKYYLIYLLVDGYKHNHPYNLQQRFNIKGKNLTI